VTGQPRPPAARAQRYAVGLRVLSALLAGRVLYRLIHLATTVLLLPAWGADRYGRYAAAMATFSWLIAVVFTGPEKTVLKLVPRSSRTGPAVVRALLAVLWWLPVPVAAGFGLALLAGAGGNLPLYLGVAAMLLASGCTLLLIGLHRSAGRLRSDSTSFLVMSAGQLVLFGLAAADRLEPAGYVAAVTGMQVAINLALTVTLDRPSLAILRRRRFLRRLAWTALLLAGTDLFLYVATAVLFGVLASSAHAGQLGRLYALSVVWTAGVTTLLYVLRVYAPRTSLRLAGRAGAAGRDRAARLATVVAAGNAIWLAGAGTVVWLGGLAAVSSATGQVLVWAGLLATRAPAVALLLWASYLLENTDATAPRVVGLAAVAGLAGAVAVGLPAVPALGGVGVILALAVGDLGYAAVVATRGRRRRRGAGGRERVTTAASI
jgi:hypothetical protein